MSKSYLEFLPQNKFKKRRRQKGKEDDMEVEGLKTKLRYIFHQSKSLWINLMVIYNCLSKVKSRPYKLYSEPVCLSTFLAVL